MSHSNYNAMLRFLLLGVCGVCIFSFLYTQAFPIASLHFKINHQQAFDKANNFLAGLGYDVSEYAYAQTFSRSAQAQVFLERTVGLENANDLSRRWVSIWYWQMRWFQPNEQEELRVYIDPNGRVVRFSHLLSDITAGASLQTDQALDLAQGFLNKTLAINLADYDLIEQAKVNQKARIDHTFEFQKKQFVVGDGGRYRLQVKVLGGDVGYFQEYLKVPQTFQRHYGNIRSQAQLLSQIARFFWFVLGIVLLVLFIEKIKTHQILWKNYVILGIGIGFVVLVGQLNDWPLSRFYYQTVDSYTFFIFQVVSMGILTAFLLGGIICLTGAVGGAVEQDIFDRGSRIGANDLSKKIVFSSQFVTSVGIGYGLAFGLLGYVTIYYWIGSQHFGVWSPSWLLDYDRTFGTTLPWVYPLLIGLVASTLEEFFFRLLAISFLLRWLKKKWLAVLIPAMVWGFLHSNYPIEPIFTRGIELTLVGVVFGYVFLRYGIWSTVVAHYVFNAFLGALPMLKSENFYFLISGLSVICILVFPMFWVLFRLHIDRRKGKDGR